MGRVACAGKSGKNNGAAGVEKFSPNQRRRRILHTQRPWPNKRRMQWRMPHTHNVPAVRQYTRDH